VKEDLSVVLVSNRGPVSFVQSNGNFQTQRGAGGLAGALDWAARELGERAMWIASAISSDDKQAMESGATDELSDELGYRVRLIDIDPGVYDQYYDAVSNRMLWFANHCLWDELGIQGFGEREIEAWNNGYEPVNKRFAKVASECFGEDALVLFQDYHLATAPGHLRKQHPNQAILHFTHSSFCGPGGLGRLPRPIPTAVIEGMLGADLVGFHVDPWARGFYECCEEVGARVDADAGVVELDGRRSWVRSYPIPIDADELRQRAAGKEARGWARRFVEETPGRLIVRADRTEPSKNIVRGFDAYGLLLDRRPDLRTTRFVACLYPSRQSMPEYQRYEQAVRESVARVNGRHPGAIDLFLENDFDRTMGALMVYDALLVNSMMDGMNLVSKEGASVNETGGVLVLSRGAGSFDELGADSLEISDPLSVEATARALEEALDMPMGERMERGDRLRAKVETTKPQDWIDAQIEDLVAIKERREPLSATTA
jgi:trehalose 6-phosphate synthase